MRITTHQLQQRAAAGEKLVMLTCYDASFAGLSDAAGEIGRASCRERG